MLLTGIHCQDEDHDEGDDEDHDDDHDEGDDDEGHDHDYSNIMRVLSLNNNIQYIFTGLFQPTFEEGDRAGVFVFGEILSIL